MYVKQEAPGINWGMLVPIILLQLLSVFMLNSLGYLTVSYLIFVFFSFVLYFVFASIDFEILSIFSKYAYIASIVFLILPIIIGQATRGTIRWIPIGSFSLQPAELVRPFLFTFCAVYLSQVQKTIPNLVKASLLFAFPTFLILIQPSLGVTLLTSIGFLGILLSSRFPKKYYLIGILIILISMPIGWNFLADYQKTRILTFLSPTADPMGVGYNSLQATISVGSGRVFGRGLGRGVGTQLAFLPERQTDFIFASIGEELGFVGAVFALLLTFFLLSRILAVFDGSQDRASGMFVAAVFLSFLAQVFIHVGMNMSLLPITGVPYPLLSAGGSSLMATMITLGMVARIKHSNSQRI